MRGLVQGGMIKLPSFATPATAAWRWCVITRAAVLYLTLCGETMLATHQPREVPDVCLLPGAHVVPENLCVLDQQPHS